MTRTTGTQAIDRAVSLLKLIAAHDAHGMRLSQVALRQGLTQPTAHRLLRALERQALLTFDCETGRYHLGIEAYVLGVHAAERYGLHRAALPSLAKLAQSVGDTCFLSAQVGWHAVCLHREEGPFPIRTHALVAGERHPLGVGSGSMAIFASLPDCEIEEAIEANRTELDRRFPNCSPDLLRKQVAETRKRGFSINPGLVLAGSWGVGVAILNDLGRCEGALSIGAIENRMSSSRQKEIARLLQKEAAELGGRLRRLLPKGLSERSAYVVS
jgi:DNA-binding IclR family transcriptional regulator